MQFFYKLNALPDTQPTVSKHWRQDGRTGESTEKVDLRCTKMRLRQKKKVWDEVDGMNLGDDLTDKM